MFSVPYNPIQIPTPQIGGDVIKQLRDLKVGSGGEMMSVDRDGNVKFAGELSAASGTFTGDTNWANVQAGTNANALNIGAGNVKIDGANKRIIINDGSNDRVLIGYAQNMF